MLAFGAVRHSTSSVEGRTTECVAERSKELLPNGEVLVASSAPSSKLHQICLWEWSLVAATESSPSQEQGTTRVRATTVLLRARGKMSEDCPSEGVRGEGAQNTGTYRQLPLPPARKWIKTHSEGGHRQLRKLQLSKHRTDYWLVGRPAQDPDYN
jgi:hypothetical protein